MENKIGSLASAAATKLSTKNNNNNSNNSKGNNHFRTSVKALMQIFKNRKLSKRRSVKRVSLTVIVLGSESVGKTSVIKLLCGEKYESVYKNTTVLDVYDKETMINELLVKFEFLDLSGAHSFPAMRKLYIEKADIFFLVYDRTCESLDEILRLKSEIESVRKTHISELPVAVIKAKCDSSRSRKIQTETEKNLSHWCRNVFRCSAKRGTNIAEIEEFLLSEGTFADVAKTSCQIRERTSSHRLSGRYIYTGRQRAKSMVLNRGPRDRPDSTCCS